jgi:hypothetical protein
MSQQYIGLAARQRAAITPIPEDSTASPYLDHVRRPRDTVEDLIAAREVELVKTTIVEQRQRMERELSFLRDEFAQFDGRGFTDERSRRRDQLA